MISHNEETVFKITFEAKNGDKWEDIYETEKFFNYLPRIGDIVIIDSCYMQVLLVEYSDKNQFNPIVRVKQLGHFEDYSQSHL